MKRVGFPPRLKQIFLNEAGVGAAASGYSFGSNSCILLELRITKGGNFVVVVVVVVTTVVWVAGAKENCPSVLLEST